MKIDLPFRQVHLDFHTSPFIRDVGSQFDADQFAQTFADAHVNSVTVFAKCHHGHLYFKTDRAERHPGLDPDLDLLRLQIDALHARNIRAPIYISVLCDEFAANEHPEWIARDSDGKPVRNAGPFSTSWQILDLVSPYQDYLAEQTALVLARFAPVDGIFFDMCWDQPSCSAFAIEKMLERELDPESADDRAKFASEMSQSFMNRFAKMVRDANPNASIFFNARPMSSLPRDIEHLSHVEIEALPTGGWGYMYFPKNVRYARNFGKPYLGMTARFHKGWADFGGLKPKAALLYETAEMLAHGARCSIGDQMHPRGVLDPAAYELIGEVYQRVASCEEWCVDAKSQAEIAVILAGTSASKNSEGTDEGVVRMLSQLRHQFDLLNEEMDFSNYRLLILPDEIGVTEALAARVKSFLAGGKALLVSGLSSFDSAGENSILAHELGLVPTGLSPFVETYLRAGKRIESDVPKTDHVLYQRTVRVAPAPGAVSLAVIVEPYFQRRWQHFSSHRQTPPDKPTKFSAIVQHERAIYFAHPIFGMFARHGNAVYRTLVRNAIDLLLPDPMLRVTGPTGLEATVTKQGDRTIVHLIYFSPERRAQNLDLIEDVIPLRDVSVSLRLSVAPRRVFAAPEERDMQFTFESGVATAILPELNGHAMIVWE